MCTDQDNLCAPVILLNCWSQKRAMPRISCHCWSQKGKTTLFGPTSQFFLNFSVFSQLKINKNIFSNISEKIDRNILGPNFFDLKLTRPKLFSNRAHLETCMSSELLRACFYGGLPLIIVVQLIALIIINNNTCSEYRERAKRENNCGSKSS